MMMIPRSTPTSRPARNCHIGWSASRNQHRRQTLDVRWSHIFELEPDVEPRGATRAELRHPDHLGPAAYRGVVWEQDLQVKAAPHTELFVRVDAHPSEANVLRIAPVMQNADAPWAADDVGLHPRKSTAVSQSTDRISGRARPVLEVASLYICGGGVGRSERVLGLPVGPRTQKPRPLAGQADRQ